MTDPKANWTVRGWVYLVGCVGFELPALTTPIHTLWVEIIYRCLMVIGAVALAISTYYAFRKYANPPALIRR